MCCLEAPVMIGTTMASDHVHEVTVLPYTLSVLRDAFPGVMRIDVTTNDAESQVVEFRYGSTGDPHELDIAVTLPPDTLTDSTSEFVQSVLAVCPVVGEDRILGSQVSADALSDAQAALDAWGDE